MNFSTPFFDIIDYILSNNLLNDFIIFDYKFDEDLTSYYISFLKSLSLKMTENPMQLFYNQVFLKSLNSIL
jgi:hypothetical protein